jgi:hypothetical protein
VEGASSTEETVNWCLPSRMIIPAERSQMMSNLSLATHRMIQAVQHQRTRMTLELEAQCGTHLTPTLPQHHS